MRNEKFFQTAVLFEMGLGAVAVVIAWLFSVRLWDYCCVDGPAVLWSVAATVPMIGLYFVLQALPWDCFQRIDRLVKDFYRNEMLTLPIWKTAVVAAAAGFGEEFLFRGLLQQGIRNYLGGWDWAIIVIVSVLFGFAHYVSKTYVVLAFLISLYFGFLFYATENLLVPTVAHAVYDFFVFLQVRKELNAERRG